MNRETLIVGALQTAAGAAALASSDDPSLFDNPRLTGLYIAGSVGGALLTMMLFPQKEVDRLLKETNKEEYERLVRRAFQRLCAKGFSSLIGGWLFTPILMEYAGIELTENRILAFSAVVAMFIVSTIHAVSPKVEGLIDAWSTNLADKHKPPKDGE